MLSTTPDESDYFINVSNRQKTSGVRFGPATGREFNRFLGSAAAANESGFAAVLKELHEMGISAELINMHTIKPLDEAAILKSVAKTGCVVTAEEHMMNGGLGEAVSQVLSRNNPVAQEYVAVNDTFGESGTPMELMTKYHIDTPDVVAAVKRAIARKSIVI